MWERCHIYLVFCQSDEVWTVGCQKPPQESIVTFLFFRVRVQLIEKTPYILFISKICNGREDIQNHTLQQETYIHVLCKKWSRQERKQPSFTAARNKNHWRKVRKLTTLLKSFLPLQSISEGEGSNIASARLELTAAMARDINKSTTSGALAISEATFAPRPNSSYLQKRNEGPRSVNMIRGYKRVHYVHAVYRQMQSGLEQTTGFKPSHWCRTSQIGQWLLQLAATVVLMML